MSLNITVDDLVIEMLEEGDPAQGQPSMDHDASWEHYIRIAVEEDTEDMSFLAGAIDPTKLAIQIEVLDNSGAPRSDPNGLLPIRNDSGTTVGVISQAGSLALPGGSMASIDATRADRPVRLQVNRRRQVTICIWSKVWHGEICRKTWVLKPVGKPQEWAGPGDLLPAGRPLILKSNGSLGM
jgi:hypothetical protein